MLEFGKILQSSFGVTGTVNGERDSIGFDYGVASSLHKEMMNFLLDVTYVFKAN